MVHNRLTPYVHVALAYWNVPWSFFFFRITSLPPAICKLQLLEQLKASENRLTILPRNIHKCASLILIFIDHNRVKSLPMNIGLTPQLKMLEASHNNLKLVFVLVRMSEWLPIVLFFIFWNRNIPQSAYQVKRVLNVSFNNLSRLPEPDSKRAKVEVQTLRSLIATNNKIENIPEYIGCVPRWVLAISLMFIMHVSRRL